MQIKPTIEISFSPDYDAAINADTVIKGGVLEQTWMHYTKERKGLLFTLSPNVNTRP